MSFCITLWLLKYILSFSGNIKCIIHSIHVMMFLLGSVALLFKLNPDHSHVMVLFV